MQTHDDNSHKKGKFLETLFLRADEMRKAKTSLIAGGDENEEILAQWSWENMTVVVRPDDPQGILRISVGGGYKLPVPLAYCTIRGDIDECITLLEQALRVLRARELEAAKWDLGE